MVRPLILILLFATSLASAQVLSDKDTGIFYTINNGPELTTLTTVVAGTASVAARKDAYEKVFLTTDAITTFSKPRTVRNDDGTTGTTTPLIIARIRRSLTANFYLRLKADYYYLNGILYHRLP